MDAPVTNLWRELNTNKYAQGRGYWNVFVLVRKMRQPRVGVDIGSHVEPASEAPFTVRTQACSCKGARALERTCDTQVLLHVLSRCYA